MAARVEEFLRRYPAVPLRRAISQGRAPWVRALPRSVRQRLDLDGGRIDPLRVELGGGGFPTPGYVHVDLDRRARDLEHVAPVWRLPFADGTVREILAVHVLEHVHPAQVDATLREWRRVLAPGGWVQAHVPNTPAILAAYESVPPDRKWLLSGILFGLMVAPGMATPGSIPVSQEPEHRVAYDFDLLRHVFVEAGFSHVENLTGTVVDRHSEAWAELLADMSLVVRASVSSDRER